MAQNEVLERIALATVAVDGEGALNAALGGNGAGADVGIVRGGSVQCAAVLPHMVGTDGPILNGILLAGLGADGQHKVIGVLDALVVGAGGDAGGGNSFCNSHVETPFGW